MIWHGHALQLYQSISDMEGVAFALNNLGAQAERQGNFVDAMRHLEESLALAQQLGHARLSSSALNNMGIIARHQGEYARAVDLFSQALALSRTVGDQWFICNEQIELAKVAWYQRNDPYAVMLYTEALTLCQEMHQPEPIAECLEGLAACAVRYGQAIRAARLFGTAEYLRQVIGAPHTPLEQTWYSEVTALARATLAPIAYEQALLEGRQMPLQEAIVYAMKGDEE
jgi:tetratricopeptide (TPR) repeat protein